MLEKIFEPITINHTTFKNRLNVSAMVTNYCDESGLPTEKFMAYHEHKAKGGWGIIITEDFAISPTAGAFKRLPGFWKDEQIAPFKNFTDRIHTAGGKIVAQLYHAGRETCSAITGEQCVAPSAIKDPTMPETPRALTVDEIQAIEDQFAAAAYRAKAAGFDGIEIHGAHGYLVGQFISPFSNKRIDEYGGTIVNRARFAVEITQKIRNLVGPEFPIFYRMSTQEYVHGGLQLEEAKTLARLLEAAGVDCLHASQGVYASAFAVIPPSVVPAGGYADNAAAIKSAVSIPVIAVGRINDPYVAEEIIASGKADICTMARASLADPEMPIKAKEGRYDDIIHCIGCLQGCIGENSKGNCVRCLVNPLTGKGDEYNLAKAAKTKKVVVVGAGVAGCEAAIVAAQRGHDVTLLEKSDVTGGQWIAASVPVGKGDFTSFLVWQKHMLRKLGVTVKTEVDATADTIDELAPEAVIVATGSNPAMPPIKGLRDFSVPANDVLLGKIPVGNKVVVIGGGLVGAETAAFLAEHGSPDVTIVEMLPQIVKDGEANPTYYLMKRFEEYGVKILTSAAVQEVRADGIVYKKDDECVSIDGVDTIIAAIGVRANTTLADSLQDKSYTVISVGDCNGRAKNGYRDIQEGFEAGLTI